MPSRRAARTLKARLSINPAFITVYETHHQFANSYLKAKPTKKDERTYSQQMHVIAWHVNDKNEREDSPSTKAKRLHL